MRSTPNIVLGWVLFAAGVCALWYLAKAMAAKGLLTGLVAKLQPRVSALHAWVAAAPATFTYMAIWTATCSRRRSTSTRRPV